MQGDFNIQGGQKAGVGSGPSVAGTPFDLSWQNLSARLGPSIAAGPTSDIHGMLVSAVSDASGTSVTWIPAYACVGRPDCIQYQVGLVSGFFPEYDDPLHQILHIRFTEIVGVDPTYKVNVATTFTADFVAGVPPSSTTSFADGPCMFWGSAMPSNPNTSYTDKYQTINTGYAVVAGQFVASVVMQSSHMKPNYTWQHDGGSQASNPYRSYSFHPVYFSVDVGSKTVGGVPITAKVLLEFAVTDATL